MSKTIKAEMWDKMQYLFRNYYDRMVHATMTFDGLLDADALKNVLVIMCEKAPVLHSSFHENLWEMFFVGIASCRDELYVMLLWLRQECRSLLR